jgi:SAM-dependent methyltransferase
MDKSIDLLDQKSHFAFGENWASYAKLVTQAEIDHAMTHLRTLARRDLSGKRFLDIGCGSGLHALAALRLGAAEVVAIDIDPDSVATTQRMLQVHAAGRAWQVEGRSVFELDAVWQGQFDVVYSWGVLHHTGDMHGALRRAAALVKPGGVFIFALYRRTSLCSLWSMEKRWYAGAGPRAQAVVRRVFTALYGVAFRLRTRRSFRRHVVEYRQRRGMSFPHDVHDWLGGWPYESISPAQTDSLMRQLDMQPVRMFAHSGKSIGLFGSGCDEYVYGKA